MASAKDDNSISAELSSKLWYEAKQNLTKEEQEFIRDFHGDKGDNHGIVNDVLKTAQEKQKEAKDKNWTFKRSDGRVVVVRDLFSKIVDSITKFQGAVDFLVSMDASGHSALPWAGVKFLLSIAVKDFQKWGSVIVGMEFITREISYYGIFEVIYLRQNFSATKQLSDALVRAYTKILQFLSGARRYYDQNSFISGIKSERDDIERLRGMIDGQHEKDMGNGILTLSQDQKANQSKLVGLLNDLAAPMEIMVMQLEDVKDDLGEIHSEMKANNKAGELPKIYAHLQPGKVANYGVKVGTLTPGTATWILRNEAFVKWFEGKIPVLFVSGGPGTGKSYLSTKVIDYLRKAPLGTNQRQNHVGYYYFKDGDKSTRSVLTALCAIVYQIATEDEIYRMHATQICDRSPNFAMATCETVWNDFLAAEYGSASDNQLFLVFDGIDEAEREEFSEFLRLLSRSVLESIRIQILLVGRPEMNSVIRERFVKSPFDTIEVSSKVNIDDVRKFSQARYDECIKVPKNLKGLRYKVTETLTEKAGGMFLWVDLIYKEELQDILSPMKLKEALGHLPEGGLNNLYDRIFARVERDNGPTKHLALQELFSWIAYFKEPLSLFYLNEILHLSIGNQYSDAEVILEETCASLFILVKTGEVLLKESTRSETETQGGADHAHKDAGNNETRDTVEAELSEEAYDDENHDDDEGYDDAKEMAEIVQADEEHRNRQREIFVHLRHASLSDYLRRADLKPTALLLGSKQGQVHIVVTMLQIICKGADAPQDIWLYLMANFLDQLGSLDCSIVSGADTQIITGYLHEIFNSETLGRHISKFHATNDGYPLFGDGGGGFSFGLNTGLQNDNSLVIERWLRRAQESGLTKLDSEISKWIKQTLDNPLKLLVPLVKVCISEWLECKAEGFELYWRFRFIWQCILATDLVPPVPQGNTIDLMSDTTDFLGDNAFIFIALLSKQQETMAMHFVIAKTISFIDPGSSVAIAEYQKAITMAQEQGSADVLKEFYLQQIMAYVDVRLMEANEYAAKAIENYLKLDTSNARVLACLGVVNVTMHDNKRAIENFRKSLELNKRDYEVGIALLRTLFKMKDYEGMMSQIDHYGIPTVGAWLRDSYVYQLQEHREIMYAARMVNKVDIMVKCYEHEIQNIELSDDDLKEVKNDDPVKTAQNTLRCRTRRVAVSSMFRVYLGWLYLDILGQPDKAFEIWTTAFFQRSEFFNIGNMTSSAFTTEIIPDFFALFSQLIYEKALDPDPEIASRMIAHLEHLHRREKVFQELDKYPIGTGLRNINMLLARLYLKHGRKDRARKMLNDQFQRAIDILSDDIDWNDEIAYGALAALLFLNGQLEKSKVASSLKRFFMLGFDNKAMEGKAAAPENVQHKPDIGGAEQTDGEGEGQQPPPDKQDDSFSDAQGCFDYTRFQTRCAGWYTCENDSRRTPPSANAYSCTTCANVTFCETCFNNLHKRTEQRMLFVCSPNHEFIKTPPEGLEKIEDQKIIMNGKSILFADWLAEVRRDWKTGLCFKA